MGVHVIKMPDIGEGIAEVELVAWHVQPGDTVTEDQSLADVMTDKATVEIPSPVAGTVLALGGKLGEVMAVGSELIRIEVEGAGNVAAAGQNGGACRGGKTSGTGGSKRAGNEPGATSGAARAGRRSADAAPAARQAHRLPRGAPPRLGPGYRIAVRARQRHGGPHHA